MFMCVPVCVVQLFIEDGKNGNNSISNEKNSEKEQKKKRTQRKREMTTTPTTTDSHEKIIKFVSRMCNTNPFRMG